MRVRHLPGSVLAWALLVGAAGTLTGQLSPEQILNRRRLSDLQASPDGARLAFTVFEAPSGTNRSRHIHVLSVASRAVRQLTNSAKSEWAPRWRRDGTQLAFLSDRIERAQLWLLAMDGGEALQVTSGKNGVQEFEWSPDGAQIAFLAAAPPTDEEEKRESAKDDARVIDHDDKPSMLWVLNVASKKVRPITRSPWRISDFHWMPSGDRFLVVATDHPERDQFTDRLFTVGANDTTLSLFATPGGPFSQARPSPDGKWVAYVVARGDGPIPHDLFVESADGAGSRRNLTATSFDRPVESFEWRADGTLIVLYQDGYRGRLGVVTTTGLAQPINSTEANVSGFASLPNGQVGVVAERADSPVEVWLGALSGSLSPVTAFNAQVKGLALVEPELIRYRSFDGTVIEGALLKPVIFSRGNPVPLVVNVHGGPTGAWTDGIDDLGQLLVARGFAVFEPNIRGSTGYGWKNLISNRGDWGGGDFRDLMIGVDTLVGRGVADPDRLGIIGWSYGGYMASWAITQTTRFKGAMTGAGMSDLATEYGTEAGPAYDEWFYGLPYEKPQGFAKSSPLTYITKARTPTLILQGEADVTDPISQSQMLYRALKRYNVPTEFVVYPREGHGLQEEKHLLDRLRRTVAWIEKYLK